MHGKKKLLFFSFLKIYIKCFFFLKCRQFNCAFSLPLFVSALLKPILLLLSSFLYSHVAIGAWRWEVQGRRPMRLQFYSIGLVPEWPVIILSSRLKSVSNFFISRLTSSCLVVSMNCRGCAEGLWCWLSPVALFESKSRQIKPRSLHQLMKHPRIVNMFNVIGHINRHGLALTCCPRSVSLTRALGLLSVCKQTD